ncbi:MAG: hypothetical protein HY430_04040 [Candidatus Levybacteria bacterium]|nr:hypothetical protein [Candidatus Levybacteria bacterium]
MATQTLIKELNKEIKILRRDVSQIKSALVDIEGDAEGEYRREFVAKVLKRAQEKPIARYRGGASFLKYVRTGAK